MDEKYTSDYHGLLHAHTLFPSDSGSPSTRLSSVELNSLAFKVRRKRFQIEQFTLPPEEEEEVEEKKKRSSGAAMHSVSAGGSGCGGSTSNSSKLDF